ncbi:MAG: hypothetical protein SH819_13310 [Cytophagales bacterium]|nr:hypothetical protein [Cytophagales bacterium]
MKNLSYRIWLIILGVAVALVIALTTSFWRAPDGAPSEAGQAQPSSGKKTFLPKIAVDAVQYFFPRIIPGRPVTPPG